MTEATYLNLTAAVLVAHQRVNMTACLCGWADLGRSHAVHVARVLDHAGALRRVTEEQSDD